MRWDLKLARSEERIEKLVDTAQNEPRKKCEKFDEFSNKEVLVSIIKMRNRRIFEFCFRFWKQLDEV